MAVLQVYAEVGEDGGCLLFTSDPPGLLCRGQNVAGALAAGSSEASQLRHFLAECDCLGLLKDQWSPVETPQIDIIETISRRGVVANGNTRATFRRDLEPVIPNELPGFLTILEHLRDTLWTLKGRIPLDAYDFRSLPRRMTIGEQLKHIAACDRWYLSRFWTDLPRLRNSTDVWDRLALNRNLALERLGNLTAEERAAVRTADREVWTPRKLFRRFMYHERFHRDTIVRDLELFRSGR